MAVIKCKMCGGDLEISSGTTVAECEYCGTKQTLPKANEEVMRNLFNRANALRLKNEFDKAEQIYEKILQENEEEAEAHWGIVLCKYGIEYVEDPKTYERIPTCHRTSYDAVLADTDYLAAIAYADSFQQSIYEAEATAIDGIQRSILSIVKDEKPFDVFLCYKETDESGKRTVDSAIANDIYHQLTQEGLKVFFAAITLEDKLGQEYEPYIFAALNSARVMLVIGTKPHYFTGVWVRNEWSRFLKLMKTDRSKLLIPCYRDMDAYELPEEFSHLQAQDMSKIGFINDVVRGIRKVVGAEKGRELVGEPARQQQVYTQDIAPLLRRVELFLEDGEFDRADDFCEQVLNIDPENAAAYIGKLQVEFRCSTKEALLQLQNVILGSKNYKKILRFGTAEQIEFIENVNKHIEENIQLEAERKRKKAEEDREKKLADLQNEGIDPDDFVDVVCPHCNEILSYPPAVILREPVRCPICGYTIDFTGHIDDIAQFLHMEASLVAEIVKEAEEQREAELLIEEEEIERLAAENVKRKMNERRALGLCQYCGGAFRGVFANRCSGCGLKKDY